MWLPAVNLAASLHQACRLNSSPLSLVVSSIFFDRRPRDFALVQLSHFISCLPQFPHYEVRLKWFAEHPSPKQRDRTSRGGLGEGECRVDHLQVQGRRWDIFRWVFLINGAIITFQMLFGEGKAGIKGNLQPMKI